MNSLFLALFLLAIAGWIVGAIKPSWVKLPTRKSVSMWFGGAVLVFFILFGVTSSPSTAPAIVATTEVSPEVPAVTTQQENTPAPTATPVAAPAPAQPDLETTLKGIVAKATGTTDVAYRSIEIENDDSDRPAGSKMLTVDVNVTSFYNRDAFIKDTGKLAAQLFQATVPSSLKPYDIFIWFHGETTDRYGNKKDSVITVYSIDKVTYAKINWSNFDPKTLCDFLKQEEKIQGVGTGPSCTITANVQ